MAFPQFRVTVTDPRASEPDSEEFRDLEDAREAVRGGLVLLPVATADQLFRYPPQKVGEANLATCGDVQVKLERVG